VVLKFMEIGGEMCGKKVETFGFTPKEMHQ
jgi:hypothetical protein